MLESLVAFFVFFFTVYGLISERKDARASSYGISLIILCAIFFCLAFTFLDLFFSKNWYSELFLHTSRSTAIKVGLIFFSGVIGWFTFDFWAIRPAFEYPILVLINLLGLLLAISANDLLIVYLGLEVSTLCAYVLSALGRSRVSFEGALKYFALGAVSSGFLLLGILLLYGLSAQTNLLDVACWTNLSRLNYLSNGWSQFGIFVGFALIFVAFMFKLTVAPFHAWGIDAYSGAPLSVVLIFMTLPKIVLCGLLVRLLELSGVFESGFGSILYDIFLLCAVLSFLIGALGALLQTQIKRFAAYSTLGHMGFIVVSVASGVEYGFRFALFYIFVYSLLLSIFFGVLLILERNLVNGCDRLLDLKGLYSYCPELAIILALVLFSMAGLPPLLGFVAKFRVLYAAVAGGMFFLPLIGIVMSVLSCYYYIRLIDFMFFSQSEKVSFIVFDSRFYILRFLSCVNVFGLTAFVL